MFDKLREKLSKTKESFDIKISNVFSNKKDIDEIIDDIEETLILSDVGAVVSSEICENVRQQLKKQVEKDEDSIKKVLKAEMEKILLQGAENVAEEVPSKKVILIVGVNGVGKTTSIGKLTNLYKNQGKKVLLAAADTFRAGAIEQLNVWAERSNADIVLGKEMQDPSSVIYDASKKFKDEDYDLLICDTAGRLHNKKNLMDELQKMRRILDKNLPDIPKEVIIVLDATTGQNGAVQVKNFFDSVHVDGIILTKLDSTAKGGVVFNIVGQMNIPIKYIGTGEQIDDLEVFNAKDFVDAII